MPGQTPWPAVALADSERDRAVPGGRRADRTESGRTNDCSPRWVRTRSRVRFYRKIIILEWALVFLVLLTLRMAGEPMASIGLGAPRLDS